MTEIEAINAILSQWKTGWQALHPTSESDPQYVPWTTTNEDFAPDQLGALGAWARISVQHTAAEQATMGSAPSRKFERRGNVFVQLFAPKNNGVALLATLAEDVRTVLEGGRLGEVNIYAGRTVELPEDGVWAMATVILPFRYTRTR
jgi:hypothetical protein